MVKHFIDEWTFEILLRIFGWMVDSFVDWFVVIKPYFIKEYRMKRGWKMDGNLWWQNTHDNFWLMRKKTFCPQHCSYPPREYCLVVCAKLHFRWLTKLCRTILCYYFCNVHPVRLRKPTGNQTDVCISQLTSETTDRLVLASEACLALIGSQRRILDSEHKRNQIQSSKLTTLRPLRYDCTRWTTTPRHCCTSRCLIKINDASSCMKRRQYSLRGCSIQNADYNNWTTGHRQAGKQGAVIR